MIMNQDTIRIIDFSTSVSNLTAPEDNGAKDASRNETGRNTGGSAQQAQISRL